MNKSSCNLCESDNHRIIFKQLDSYEYSVCVDCGHVYQSNRKDLEHYYNLPYESQWKDYENHSENRANYIADFSDHYIKNSKKIVDIGCGPGGTIKFLKKRFPNSQIHGITAEIDRDIMIDAFEVIYCNFETDEIGQKETYDFAVMCHVLEHFIEPKVALNKARKLIKDGGYLYVEVPSFNWVGVRSNPEFCPVHISYFTLDKLKHALISSGFQIVKFHESRYWGNIKILVKKCDTTENKDHNLSWRWVTFVWRLNKIFGHRLYRLLRKIVKVNPND